MTIHVLPPDVAAKIAAGEVVERPANVAKELIENSLDAGATDIRVEIREGGQRLLRVSDNGHGIAAAEAELAFLRHATSKLNSADDLLAIGTFGFRGEALYSIAAVSHVTLITRTPAEETGVQLRVEGGELINRQKAGAPAGTVVTVEHLFFNVPARKKFLRKPAGEASQIAALVQRLALAHPEHRFCLINEGRTVLQTTGSGDLFDVLAALYGLENAKQMIPIGSQRRASEVEAGAASGTAPDGLAEEVDFMAWTGPVSPRTADGQTGGQAAGSHVPNVRITGYTSLPSLSRANRGAIDLFVNRRYVEDRNLTYAVIQGYHTLLPSKRFPLAVVLIDIDPSQVDVNVHPQKTQVRFVDERRLYGVVQRAVQQALLQRTPAPGMSLPAHGATVEPKPWTTLDNWSQRRAQLIEAGRPQTAPLWDTNNPRPDSSDFPHSLDRRAAGHANRHEAGQEDEHEDTGSFQPSPTGAVTGAEIPSQEPSDARDTKDAKIEVQSSNLPPLRVVGQIGATYIVAEGPEGMFLIDQHAAHERILYEKFMSQRFGAHNGEIAAQHLLEPLTLHLGHDTTRYVAEHLEELQAVGYAVEPFGGDAFLVRAVPGVLADQDPTQTLAEIAAALADRRNRVGETFEERLVKMVCKRASIKAGQLLSPIEMQELLRQLEACRAPRTCPHGRPTMIQLSAGELEKAFGRI